MWARFWDRYSGESRLPDDEQKHIESVEFSTRCRVVSFFFRGEGSSMMMWPAQLSCLFIRLKRELKVKARDPGRIAGLALIVSVC